MITVTLYGTSDEKILDDCFSLAGLDIFPELAEQPQKSDAIRQRSVVGNRMYLMYFVCFIKFSP